MEEGMMAAAQLRHVNSLLRSRLERMELETQRQFAVLEQRIRQLEAEEADHETRLRSATEGVTQFKLFSGLVSGSSTLMSIAALLRVFLGG